MAVLSSWFVIERLVSSREFPNSSCVFTGVCDLLRCSLKKAELATDLLSGGEFVGLQFTIIVRELVVENGDGHAIENDAKGNAGKGEKSAQVSLWEHIAVPHGRDADLEGSMWP